MTEGELMATDGQPTPQSAVPMSATEAQKMREMAAIETEVKSMHNDLKDVPTVLKSMLKAPKRALYTSIITSLCVVVAIALLIVVAIVVTGKTRDVADLRRVTTQYGLIESRANYLMILKKTHAIEKEIHQKMAICGRNVKDRKRLTLAEKEDYATCVYVGKVYYDIDENLSLAITSAESDWNKKAMSSRRAMGLWQVLESTFDWINEIKLDKYGNHDIWNVFNNSEVAVRYIYFIKRTLRYQLGRDPNIIEIAWGYHAGKQGALSAIVSGKPEKVLGDESIEYGKKVTFYYKQYKDYNYSAWWYEQFLKQNTDKQGD